MEKISPPADLESGYAMMSNALTLMVLLPSVPYSSRAEGGGRWKRQNAERQNAERQNAERRDREEIDASQAEFRHTFTRWTMRSGDQTASELTFRYQKGPSANGK